MAISENLNTIAQLDRSADAAIGRAQADAMSLGDHLRVMGARLDKEAGPGEREAYDAVKAKIDSLDIGKVLAEPKGDQAHAVAPGGPREAHGVGPHSGTHASHPQAHEAKPKG